MKPRDAAVLLGILIRLDRRRRRRKLSYGEYIKLRKIIIAEFMLSREERHEQQ